MTDINLSLDDRFLYVSCWGTGEFIQYDTVWSFLMASAHGAGLMVLPVLLGNSAVEAANQMAGHTHTSAAARPLAGLLATGVHAIGYLAVTGAVAWLVYRKLGLALLRKAWLNLDAVWAAALLVTGVVTLVS